MEKFEKTGTFYDGLHPLFITSKAVTDELIDELLRTAEAKCRDRSFDDYADNYQFTLQRTKEDAARELTRVVADEKQMYGTQPPVGPNPPLAFEGWSLDELARYVLENFADEVTLVGDKYVVTTLGPELDAKDRRSHIDNEFFVVMDERSAWDRSVIMVQMPIQDDGEPGNPDHRLTRNWVKRENHLDSENWRDDEESQELHAVRVAFSATHLIDWCQLGEDGLEEFSDEVDETGVFSEESRDAYANRRTGKLGISIGEADYFAGNIEQSSIS